MEPSARAHRRLGGRPGPSQIVNLPPLGTVQAPSRTVNVKQEGTGLGVEREDGHSLEILASPSLQ